MLFCRKQATITAPSPSLKVIDFVNKAIFKPNFYLRICVAITERHKIGLEF